MVSLHHPVCGRCHRSFQKHRRPVPHMGDRQEQRRLFKAGLSAAGYSQFNVPGSLTTEKRSDRKYEVEFRNVSFRYPGSEQWALHNVNLRFRVGERMAVVGENLAPAKRPSSSCSADCMTRRKDRFCSTVSTSESTGTTTICTSSRFVPFRIFQLISQPLGDNVAGSCRYDREKVETVLRKVGFGERLDRMPNGLDTVLYRDFSETGVELSRRRGAEGRDCPRFVQGFPIHHPG